MQAGFDSSQKKTHYIWALGSHGFGRGWSIPLRPFLDSKRYLCMTASVRQGSTESDLKRNIFVEGFDWKILKRTFISKYFLVGKGSFMHKRMYLNGMYSTNIGL